jgi:hypothetical protein
MAAEELDSEGDDEGVEEVEGGERDGDPEVLADVDFDEDIGEEGDPKDERPFATAA